MVEGSVVVVLTPHNRRRPRAPSPDTLLHGRETSSLAPPAKKKRKANNGGLPLALRGWVRKNAFGGVGEPNPPSECFNGSVLKKKYGEKHGYDDHMKNIGICVTHLRRWAEQSGRTDILDRVPPYVDDKSAPGFSLWTAFHAQLSLRMKEDNAARLNELQAEVPGDVGEDLQALLGELWEAYKVEAIADVMEATNMTRELALDALERCGFDVEIAKQLIHDTNGYFASNEPAPSAYRSLGAAQSYRSLGAGQGYRSLSTECAATVPASKKLEALLAKLEAIGATAGADLAAKCEEMRDLLLARHQPSTAESETDDDNESEDE